MMQHYLPYAVSALLSMTVVSGTCCGTLISNGGFEAPILAPDTFMTLSPGGEPAGFVWQVSSGTVDVSTLPVNPFVNYPAFAGNQALDLNGTNRGTIFQDLATTPGQDYTLSFAYADNPVEAGISMADVTLTDIGTTTSVLSTSIMHSTSTNGPPANADWTLFSNQFTAIGTTTRLMFASTSASNSASGGIILDAVSVTSAAAIPEPTSLLLAGFAACLFAIMRLRRRAPLNAGS